MTKIAKVVGILGCIAALAIVGFLRFRNHSGDNDRIDSSISIGASGLPADAVNGSAIVPTNIQAPPGGSKIVSGNLPKSSAKSLVIRGVNWYRYPGTLGDQVRKAVEAGDPGMSLFLAQRLADCVRHVALPEEIARRNWSNGLGVSAEDQQMKSLCQSVEGDWQEAAFRLYEQAVGGGVVGAAAGMFKDAGKLTPAASERIVLDARQGHLWSAILVAAVPNSVLGTSSEDQIIARYAVEAAARLVDEKVGEKWAYAVKNISHDWAWKGAVEGRKLSSNEKQRMDSMVLKLVEAAKSGEL